MVLSLESDYIAIFIPIELPLNRKNYKLIVSNIEDESDKSHFMDNLQSRQKNSIYDCALEKTDLGFVR